MRFFAEGVLAIDVYSLPKIREITHSNSTTVCPALQASHFPPPSLYCAREYVGHHLFLWYRGILMGSDVVIQAIRRDKGRGVR